MDGLSDFNRPFCQLLVTKEESLIDSRLGDFTVWGKVVSGLVHVSLDVTYLPVRVFQEPRLF